MSYSLHFEPLSGILPLFIAIAAALAVLAFACYKRAKGSCLRVLASAFFLCLLINPVLQKDVRKILPGIAAIIVDNSQSQNFGARKQDTMQALAKLQRQLSAFPHIETRIIQAAVQDAKTAGATRLETQIFTPLREALADVPAERISGVILLTDGQIADIPHIADKDKDAAERLKAQLGFFAPINALISGGAQEYLRSVRFVKAPRFGLKSKELPLSFIVQDEGKFPEKGQPVIAELFLNGEKQGQYSVQPGIETEIAISLPQIGSNIVELKIPPIKGQITDRGSRAAIIIDAVRENLKALLVSGEPHNGLRLWRDLLKSDTGVNLVHFTILRPPEKQDNTPISQLSLIVFPTTDLFVNRLQDFDLVIFDRYQHYDVLPLLYYEYMARYVENGGALLMAAGPEFSGGSSLSLTPLARILPARPTGNIFEKPFLPHLTKAGESHPVTQNLHGESSSPQWGRWLRQIEAEADDDAAIVMQGVNNKPLLILAHKGEGRVAMLLSDEGWLWARGYEGGGPYAALYRRIAHWLMKEPALEEERLTARQQGQKIFLERRSQMQNLQQAMTKTLADARQQSAQAANLPNSAQKQNVPAEADGLFHIILPSGKAFSLPPSAVKNAVFSADFTTDETGLVRIHNGGKNTFIYAGTPDMPEYNDIIATGAKLAPIAAATGGHILPMHKTAGDKVQTGAIYVLKAGENISAAADSLILQPSRDSKIIKQEKFPLMVNFWSLLFGLALLTCIWLRETRA